MKRKLIVLFVLIGVISTYLITSPSSVWAGDGSGRKSPDDFTPNQVADQYVSTRIREIKASLTPSTREEWQEYQTLLQTQKAIASQQQYRLAQEQKRELFSIIAPGYLKFESKLEEGAVQLILNGKYTPEQLNAMSMRDLTSVLGLSIPVAPRNAGMSRNLKEIVSSVSVGTARRGDVILVHNGPWWKPAFYGWWTHAIMTLGYNHYIHAVGPGHRNQYTTWARSIRGRTIAVMGVWAGQWMRNRAASFANAQYGEWYNILSAKWNLNEWYCSKLPWAGYFYKSWGIIDIDSNGGYWVTPSNIFWSVWTYLRGFSWSAP